MRSDYPQPYVVDYDARLHKHVVIDTATRQVVAELESREAAQTEADRLIDQWLKDGPDEVQP